MGNPDIKNEDVNSREHKTIYPIGDQITNRLAELEHQFSKNNIKIQELTNRLTLLREDQFKVQGAYEILKELV